MSQEYSRSEDEIAYYEKGGRFLRITARAAVNKGKPWRAGRIFYAGKGLQFLRLVSRYTESNDLAQRANIEVLAKQCGTSIAMIEQHYSHVIPKMFSDQLSGVEMDEVKQIKDRFDISKELAKASYAKRAALWQTNYKEHGCI